MDTLPELERGIRGFDKDDARRTDRTIRASRASGRIPLEMCLHSCSVWTNTLVRTGVMCADISGFAVKRGLVI